MAAKSVEEAGLGWLSFRLIFWSLYPPSPLPSGWTDRAVARVGALLPYACGGAHAYTMAAKSVEQAGLGCLSCRWLWFETQ